MRCLPRRWLPARSRSLPWMMHMAGAWAAWSIRSATTGRSATRWRRSSYQWSREAMHLQAGVSPILVEDIPRAVDVWEASVRATHHFVSEADIQIFRPMVRDALSKNAACACVRDHAGQVAGFVAVAESNVDMLF